MPCAPKPIPWLQPGIGVGSVKTALTVWRIPSDKESHLWKDRAYFLCQQEQNRPDLFLGGMYELRHLDLAKPKRFTGVSAHPELVIVLAN